MSDEPRRRAVRAAIARRPDMELDDLRRVLARVGIDVDTETLIADLAAVGYGLAIVPTGTPTRRVAPAAPRLDDADGEEPLGSLWPGPLLVVAVVVFALLVVGILVLGDDDPTAGPDPIPTTLPLGAEVDPAAGSEPTATSEPTAAAVPADDPALTDPDVTLGFDDDSAILPPPGDAAAWTPIAGDFEVVDGQAVSSGLEPISLATFPVPGSDTRAQVTLPTVVAGAGLSFQTADGVAYAWVAAPDDSTAALHRLDGTETVVVLDAVLSALAPGLRLGINAVGPRIELLADGVVVATSDELGAVAAVGLAAIDGDARGVFDDLLVQYP